MNLKLILLIFFCHIPYYFANKTSQKVVIDDISDIKDFKKLLRTKTNVLVCFVSSTKQSQPIIKVFREVAQAIRGQGTMVLIDCSTEAKKLCKKVKVNPDPYILKHYKDGEFNKDYDRKTTVPSMINFMRDPTGDIPWEEDSTAEDVLHIADPMSLSKILKKETKPIMVMFYAPWCGFCKQLKPDYATAATELKGYATLAAIDVNRPENAVIRTQYNITGFPTLLYFENGKMKYHYEGDNNKNGIINFMKNPQAAPVKMKEPEWSETDNEIVHLTTENFDLVLKDEASVLVMFYAPWCGHCKRMKPEYEKAANEMKAKKIPGMLAALDATKESVIAQRYSVKGYPTVKYFSFGKLKFDVNVRDAVKIVEFMKNPKEPPPPPPPEKLWSEEPSEVVHLSEETFKPFLKKKKHALVIFYAPWCGHCKKAKPEFTAAAEHFKDDPKIAFAAVDCTQYTSICNYNEVKGYPTIKYFNYYKINKPYNGGRLEADFVRFMSNPDSATSGGVGDTADESEWEDLQKSVVHLNDETFNEHVKQNKSYLVLFYAPWCSHCKRMKPEFVQLAKELSNTVGIKCIASAVNCAANPKVSNEYSITEYPTIKLFKNGEILANYSGGRTKEEMKQFLLKYLKRVDSKDEL